MSARTANVMVMLATVTMVAVSIYLIVERREIVIEQTQRTTPSSARALPPAAVPEAEPSAPVVVERTPVRPAMEREASQRLASGVYRCQENGRIIYADQPCMNGQAVAK